MQHAHQQSIVRQFIKTLICRTQLSRRAIISYYVRMGGGGGGGVITGAVVSEQNCTNC